MSLRMSVFVILVTFAAVPAPDGLAALLGASFSQAVPLPGDTFPLVTAIAG